MERDYWENIGYVGAEDLRDSIKSDVRLVSRLTKVEAWRIKTFRELAGPLMSPELASFADWINEFMDDLNALVSIIKPAVGLVDEAETELDDLAEKWYNEDEHVGKGLMETIQDLPSVNALYDLIEKAESLQKDLDARSDDCPVDWELESYVGYDSGVSKKLVSVSNKISNPVSTFVDEISGVVSLIAYVLTVIEPDNFNERY